MDADKLVEEIYAIIHTLSQQEMNTLSSDTLSRLAVKIASYKASLGEHVEGAKRLALDAENSYKLAKAEAYKELREGGTNSTDAKELALLEVREELAALVKAKHQAGLIAKLSSDCHDLIDSVKGRLIALQTERAETNVS